MTKTILPLSCSLALMLSTTSQANVEVRFSEGAPKDRFTITNQGKCPIRNLTVDLDLSKSQGKLIFDITGAGAGVEVFQPFEVTEGDIKLASADGMKDGDSTMSLMINSLKPGGRASFTIDVDDTIPSGARGMIIVAGSEIQGGEVSVKMGDIKPLKTVFNKQSKAVVPLSACS